MQRQVYIRYRIQTVFSIRSRAPKATISMYKLVSTAVQQFVSHSVQILRKLGTLEYDDVETGRRFIKLYAEHTATIFRANCAYFMVHTFGLFLILVLLYFCSAL